MFSSRGTGPDRENGGEVCLGKQGEGAGFGATHDAFFGGLEIVVARKMEPAVNDVEEKFAGEIALGGFRIGRGGVDGDADFAGSAEGGIAFEGDDVGRRGIGEEIRVELGEGAVGEEDEGEFAGRASGWGGEFRVLSFRFRVFGGAAREAVAAEGAEISVENLDGAGEGAAVEAKSGVPIGDGDDAQWRGERRKAVGEWRGHAEERGFQHWPGWP